MSKSPLSKRKCVAAAPGTPALTEAQTAEYLPQVPEWRIVAGELRREFHFKNYYEVMAFVNATAWISNRQDHHPDLEVGYDRVVMRYSTHSVKGLSENDFICAAKVDELLVV